MALEYKLNLRVLGAYQLEFTEEDISLGTQIRETLDKTHSTIAIEIPTRPSSMVNLEGDSISLMKEFQPYTPCTFLLYDTDSNGKAENTFYKFMIVESDEVVEEYIGNRTRYTHRIILIDATKLLETELMPNITLTQPIKNIGLGQVYSVPSAAEQNWPEVTTSLVGVNGIVTGITIGGATIAGAAAGTAIGLGVGAIIAKIAAAAGAAAGTAVAAGASTGAAAGSAAGPIGAAIGAGVGLMIGYTVALVTRLQNSNMAVLKDFLDGTNCRPIIPSLPSPLLIPGDTSVPKIYGLVDVVGYLNQVNAVFGPGGILEAVGVGIITLGIIAIIKMIATWCGDTHPTFTIEPSAIIMVNMTTGDMFTVSGGDNVSLKTIESSEKLLGYTMSQISYYGINNYNLKVPSNLTEGVYSYLYFFTITNIKQRNYEWWPFNVSWNDLPNDRIDIGEGYSVDIYDILNSGLACAISDVYYDASTVDETMHINAKYNSEPIYMDELLDRIENSINCRDTISTVKYTVDNNKIQSGYYSITGLIKAVSNTINGFFVNAYNKIRDLFGTIVVEDELTDNNVYSDSQIKETYNGDLTELNGNLTVLLYDKAKKFITGLSKAVTSRRKNEKYRFNAVFDIPQDLDVEPYYFKTSLSFEKKSGNTAEQILNNITLNNHIVKNDGYREPKYYFSDHARALCHIVCPEFTFTGKTLWEICLEIGELFHGIPYLEEGNIIDFRIVDDNSKKIINFEKESQVTTTNMTNYATKLFTPELQGLVQDNTEDEDNAQAVYPSYNSWVSLRSINYSDAIINSNNAGIVIEGPNSGIYKLRQLWVKCPVYNFDGTYETKEFNITNYVVEKNIWDTLDQTITLEFGPAHSTSEQGMYLYYEQGSNVIHNVAMLPENASVLGWKQTHLTIQYILKRLFNIQLTKTANDYNSSNDWRNYSFRVIYTPVHSRLNIARQSNLNDVYNQVTNNFNQTANVVSAQAFAKVAENTLEKLGNAEINTSYTTRDLIDDINIGDCLVLHNRNYYVDNKLTTLNNIDKTVTLKLTKDNYKQSDRVAVAREYRQYNIDSNNQVRKTLSKPYQLIVSTEPIKIADDSLYMRNYTSKNKQLIARSIKETLHVGAYPSFKRLTSAFISLSNENGGPIVFNKIISGKAPQPVSNKMLPIMSDVLGNTITFQWDMYDNFSAGRKVKQNSLNSVTSLWLDRLSDYNATSSEFDPKETWGQDTERWRPTQLIETNYGITGQDDSRYCDDIGGTPRVYTSFFSMNKDVKLPVNMELTYPDTSLNKSTLTNYTENQLALDFIADKDTREALSFQVTISAQTFDKDIDIYNLLRYNPLVSDRNNITTPKWYGFNNNYQPDDSGYYTPISANEIKPSIYGPIEYKGGDPYVSVELFNNKKVFDGLVLLNENGRPDKEVLLVIRKEIPVNKIFKVYFTVFEDELGNKDIGTREIYDPTDDVDYAEEFVQLNEYTPLIILRDNKFYIDLEDLQRTGISVDEFKAALVTKHTTIPRGIHRGFHGRSYSHHKKGDNLYITSNTYVGNPYKGSTRWSNNKVKQDFLFSTINIDPETGELYYDQYRGTRHNIYDYLNYHMISKQDFGIGRHIRTFLKYGFRLVMGSKMSNFNTPITVYYNASDRKPNNIYIA